MKPETKEQIDDLIVALMAAVVCLENLPAETLEAGHYTKAADLVFRLVYTALPAGSTNDPKNGLALGWETMAQTDGGEAVRNRLRRGGN